MYQKLLDSLIQFGLTDISPIFGDMLIVLYFSADLKSAFCAKSPSVEASMIDRIVNRFIAIILFKLNYKKIDHFENFISEGTAVYFDQTNLDRIAYFNEILKRRKKKKISVKDVWNNWSDYSTSYSYNLAGLFVGDLIIEYGRDKFLEFFTDQTYKNAQKVFGKEFDDFVKEVERNYSLN